MNQYEVTFIVDPVLSGDEIKGAAETYKDLLKDEGCTIISFDSLGLKQLAYTIKKRNSGVYYTIEFNTPTGVIIPKLELSLRRDERIIRFLSVKLDKYGIKYNEDKRNGLIGSMKEKKKKDKDSSKDSKSGKNAGKGAKAAPAAATKEVKKEAPQVKEEAKVEQKPAVVAEKVVEQKEAPKVEEKAAPKVEEKVAPKEEAKPEPKAEAPKVEEKAIEKVVEEKPKVVEEKIAAAPVVAQAAAAKVVEEKVVEEKVVEEKIVEKVVEKEEYKVTDGGDNFTKIEGVGPKTHELLRSAGLKRYRDLAGLSLDDTKAILTKAGSPFSGFDPGSWGQQAQLAEDGKWDELKTLQDKLVGGK